MHKKIIFSLLYILLVTKVIFSNDRGLYKMIKSLDEYAEIGKQYAVLIAIDTYENWNPLKGPGKDAVNLKSVLKSNYYIDEFVELYNQDATKQNIIKLFKNLQARVKSEDSVLIFYAGHGHLDDASETGFWIPVDGGIDEDIQDNWLPNQQIRGLINKMKSRHICLISDSCFSGDLLDVTRAAQPRITNDYYKKSYKRISRQVLTSGASETVSDDSDFARQLILALEGNNRPIIDPMILFNEIKLGVKNQTPMFGELSDTGHQRGGSFLLFKKEEDLSKKISDYESVLNKISEKSSSLEELFNNAVALNQIIRETQISDLNTIRIKAEGKIVQLKSGISNMIAESLEGDLIDARENNVFDPSLEHSKKYLDAVEQLELSSIENKIRTNLIEINEFKINFENEINNRINDVLKYDKTNKSDIEKSYASIIDIKRTVSDTKSTFPVLSKKIDTAYTSINLNESLLNVTQKRQKAKRELPAFIIGGSICSGLGIVSGGMIGTFFGLQNYYYDSMYLPAEQDYLDNPTQTGKDQSLYYAELANNFAYAGFAMIPVTSVLIITGVVLYVVAPYDFKFKKDIERIQDRIEMFNAEVSFQNHDLELTFSLKL